MRYHDITKDDMKNGDGLRAVLWLSGCEHRCPGCQNPVTWDPQSGLLFDEHSREELMSLIGREYISGLTLSGGDPLYPGNRTEILELCSQIKRQYPTKTIWLYTGYSFENIVDLPIIQYLDVCIDGEYIESLRDIKLKWRGSANQRVIDVKSSLKAGSIVLYCD